MKVLSDSEFIAMGEKWGNSDLVKMFLDERREAISQFFDDNSGDPLIVPLEETN